MSVRNWKRAAVWFMLPALVLLCCTGCKKKEQDTFAELRLEDGELGNTEKKEAEEIGKSEERTSGTKDPGTEKQSMPESETSGDLSGDKEPELVFVHVCGAVVSPAFTEWMRTPVYMRQYPVREDCGKMRSEKL